MRAQSQTDGHGHDLAKDASALGHRRHDAATSQPLPADLELWLDEHDEVALVAHERVHRWEHEGEGDEAQIGDDHVEATAQVIRVDVADVGGGQISDAGIGRHLGGELVVADVKGGHVSRPVLEEHLGEAPRARADVQAAPSLYVDRPALQGMEELECRPPHPLLRLVAQLDGRLGGDGSRGLGRRAPVDAHRARVEKLARLGARAHEAASHQLGIEPAWGHAPPRSLSLLWSSR